MKYLLAPIFLMFLSSSYSQTYLYDGNNIKPRFEIYPDRIYENIKGKRVLALEIEDTRLYLPSKMGYDGAGNPSIVPRQLVFSVSGEKGYTYFKENGYNLRYDYHLEDDLCYTPSDGMLYPMMKLIRTTESSAKICKWFPEHYNELLARVEWKGKQNTFDTLFLFYLANLKSND